MNYRMALTPPETPVERSHTRLVYSTLALPLAVVGLGVLFYQYALVSMLNPALAGADRVWAILHAMFAGPNLLSWAAAVLVCGTTANFLDCGVRLLICLLRTTR